MHKSLVTLAISVALSVATSYAQVTRPIAPFKSHPTKPATVSPIVSSPTTQTNMLAKTGGLVLTPASGPVLLFINSQTRVPAASVHAVCDQLSRFLRLPLVVRDMPSPSPVATAVIAATDTNVAAVVAIGNSHGYPTLLIAPESRWALINVAALAEGGVTETQLVDRVQKEMLRAFGMLLGSAYSLQENCVLKPVLKPADLDDIKEKRLDIESLNKILTYTQRLGVHQRRPTTYRRAVEEGWAPAPTNSFQQAIWHELKK